MLAITSSVWKSSAPIRSLCVTPAVRTRMAPTLLLSLHPSLLKHTSSPDSSRPLSTRLRVRSVPLLVQVGVVVVGVFLCLFMCLFVSVSFFSHFLRRHFSCRFEAVCSLQGRSTSLFLLITSSIRRSVSFFYCFIVYLFSLSSLVLSLLSLLFVLSLLVISHLSDRFIRIHRFSFCSIHLIVGVSQHTCLILNPT